MLGATVYTTGHAGTRRMTGHGILEIEANVSAVGQW